MKLSFLIHSKIKKVKNYSSQSQKRKLDWFPYILLLPAVVALVIFILYPVVDAIRLSLYESTYADEHARFVGISNYITMFTSAEFWHSVKVTMIYTVLSVSGAYLIGLCTALIINMHFVGRRLVRLCLILPWAIPQVVVAMLWMLMYDYQYGVLNFFITRLGITQEAISWLGSPSDTISMAAVTVPTIWRQYPVGTIMLLAGLLMIPDELYEAAAIDGANIIHKFRYITWPGLRPVTTVLILLFIIWSFKRFDLIYLLTQGGPLHATETLTLQTYLQAFQDWHMGYAATIGTFTLIISILFSIIYLYFVGFDTSTS